MKILVIDDTESITTTILHYLKIKNFDYVDRYNCHHCNSSLDDDLLKKLITDRQKKRTLNQKNSGNEYA